MTKSQTRPGLAQDDDEEQLLDSGALPKAFLVGKNGSSE